MKNKVKIAVVGIGLMGSQHLQAVNLSKKAKLHSIVDLNKEFTITNEWIASKSGWTPYNGLKIRGLPVFTVVNGKIVMQDSEIISPPIGEPVLFNYD